MSSTWPVRRDVPAPNTPQAVPPLARHPAAAAAAVAWHATTSANNTAASTAVGLARSPAVEPAYLSMLMHFAVWILGSIGQTCVVLMAWRETGDVARLAGPLAVAATHIIIVCWMLRYPRVYYHNR